jgi:hypothetical protein
VHAARRRRHERGLVALVLGVVAHDAVAAAGVGPQVLRLARRVVGDDRVGRVEDRLRAAVVLVEHDRRDVRERLLELQDVPEVSPPEPVHAVVDQDATGDVRACRADLEVVDGAGARLLAHRLDDGALPPVRSDDEERIADHHVADALHVGLTRAHRHGSRLCVSTDDHGGPVC